jgi:holo-[acyl-carrier protein] synthase
VDLPERLVRTAARDMLDGVHGIGIDLVDVELMRSLIDSGGSSFINAYWSTAEQIATQNQVDRLAGRWAAKEAVMKSLGCGVGEIDPIDIEITAEASGAPRVVLRRGAAVLAEELNLKTCHVSITHESSWAVAIALAVRA